MIRIAVAIAGGLVLDALIGDPAVSWHPVRSLGRLAEAAEKASRRLFGAPALAAEAGRSVARPSSLRARLAGAFAWLFVAGAGGATAWLLCACARAAHPALGSAADALVVWASIAPADLAAHAGRVGRALDRDAERDGGPALGRRAVSMLVGRDVSGLDYSGVARACVESVAESSVDGAAAPLFWAALLGPWAAFAYRAVNTMDSMFGHKDDRYRDFGLVPARADDVANWLPARVSSVVACAAAPLVRGSARAALGSFLRWRLAHESPNAGHPESAYAGALGLRLGGPSRYAEGVIDKPWINPDGRDASPADIGRAVVLMYAQTVLSAAAFVAARAWITGAAIP